MRLFVAIAPPDAMRDRLAALQAGLPTGRPVAWENFHLTLAFLGDVDGAGAEDLHAALSEISAAAFPLWLDGAGAFGGDQPRAIYAAARQDQALSELREKTARAARAAGITVDAKRFTPHVTLTRLRPGRVSAAAAARWLASAAGFLSGPASIDEFVLYRSTLRPNGPVYAPLARYALNEIV